MLLRVDSNYVITAFKLFGELFRKYTLDTNLTFEVKGNTLKARVGASSFIAVNFPVIYSEGLEDVVCKSHFIDISKIIEKDSEVDIEIIDEIVTIKSKGSRINIPPNLAEVPERKYMEHEFKPLDRDIFMKSFSKMTKLNYLSNIYKTDGSIALCGDYMQRKFAVVYMEVGCQGVTTNIDFNNANLLFSFIRNLDSLEVAEYSTYYVFKSEVFYLGIPKTTPNGVKPLSEMLDKYKFLAEVDLGEDNPIGQLKNIKDLLGDKTVEIHFYEHAISLHKVLNNADVNASVGEVNLDDYCITVETLLGVFLTLMMIIGPKFRLLKGDNSICMMSGECTLVVSVL